MTIQKMTTPEGNNAIYGEVDNINYFLTSGLEADSAGAVENKEATVSAHTRRRFAGDDSPSNVDGHTRQYLYDPGRTNGSAIPGNPFILDDGTERRQFHYTGDFVDLHAFFVGEAAMDLSLYSQSAKYAIASSVDEAAVQANARKK